MSPSISAVPTRTSPKATRRGVISLLAGVAFVLPYLLLLAGAYSIFCVTTDDPFITYRYAANLLAGHGPVYNVGERVEGFTSPLHLLFMALLLKIAPSVDILFKAKLFSLSLGALALWLTKWLARAAGLSDGEGLFAQILVAANNNFALASINGLETTLFVCVILTVLLAFLRELSGRGGPLSAGLLFLALLTRPESSLLFLALLAVRLVWAYRRKTLLTDGVGWAAVFVLPAIGLLLARLAYYGMPVPNTYYAKQVTWERGWQDGLIYLGHPLSPIALNWANWRIPEPLWETQWQVLGTIVFGGLALLGCIRRRFAWAGVVLPVVILAQIAFVLRFGGDWMPGWRFLVPVLPLLAVLQVRGLRRLRGKGLLRSAPAPLVCLVLWAACAYVCPHNPWSMAHYSTRGEDLLPADNPLGRKWIATNRYIQSALPPRSVIVYSEMGYAGFKNLDKTFVDVRGLTDREIARLPALYKGTWGVDDEQWMYPANPLYQILLRRQPNAIIAFSHPAQMPPVVLERYYLSATIRNGVDPDWVIDPALVYRPLDEFPPLPPEKPK
jgi:arabinofuranosyltransferase